MSVRVQKDATRVWMIPHHYIIAMFSRWPLGKLDPDVAWSVAVVKSTRCRGCSRRSMPSWFAAREHVARSFENIFHSADKADKLKLWRQLVKLLGVKPMLFQVRDNGMVLEGIE